MTGRDVPKAKAAVTVVSEQCQGNAYCERLLPDLFRVMAGNAEVVNGAGAGADLEQLLEAEATCPTGVIVVSIAGRGER